MERQNQPLKQKKNSQQPDPYLVFHKANKTSILLSNDKENKHPIFSILKKKKNLVIDTKPSAIKKMLRMSRCDNNILTEEIKCFMKFRQRHTCHTVDQRIANRGLKKILASNHAQQNYQFDYTGVQKLAETVSLKIGDSSILLKTFEGAMRLQNKGEYPPTVQFMLNYFGSFLYSVNSQYAEAEAYCQKIFDLVVKFKAEEFFIIYLLLKIKLKTNLCQWSETIKCLTKLLSFAWMYSLLNLQIWCYFQFSRAYFFLNKERQADIFRRKSQTNIVEPRKSIYREVCISELMKEIAQIWEGKLDFSFKTTVEPARLQIPEQQIYNVQEYIADQRRLKSSIKVISQQCKIRHVNNLLLRVSQLGHHQLQSEKQTGKGQLKGGNNFLLTHQSFNKNMNMFFRNRKNLGKLNPPVMYTIENSQKSWAGLRDMLRNILMEMNHYYPLPVWERNKKQSKNEN